MAWALVPSSAYTDDLLGGINADKGTEPGHVIQRFALEGDNLACCPMGLPAAFDELRILRPIQLTNTLAAELLEQGYPFRQSVLGDVSFQLIFNVVQRYFRFQNYGWFR